MTKDPSVEIKSLAVQKAQRGHGVGAALTKAVIERVLLLRPSRIIVLTFHPDFFRDFGFKEIRKEDVMHKLYAGCINCTKYDSPFHCPEVAMSLVNDGSP